METTLALTSHQIRAIWEQTFGTSGESHEWWRSVKFLEGDWKTPGRVELTIDDPEGDYPITAVVDQQTVVSAAIEAALTCVDACTGDPITIGPLMDWDCCVSDCVLQIAVLGTVVYG